MKITRVTADNRKRAFLVAASNRNLYSFPYSRLDPAPTREDSIRRVYVDRELAEKGFTYVLRSGKESSVLLDQVLEYNGDPDRFVKMLRHKLTLRARAILKGSSIRKREVIRRMKTTPAHFYRLLDLRFEHKTLDQIVKLLAALDCPVEIAFPRKGKRAA